MAFTELLSVSADLNKMNVRFNQDDILTVTKDKATDLICLIVCDNNRENRIVIIPDNPFRCDYY